MVEALNHNARLAPELQSSRPTTGTARDAAPAAAPDRTVSDRVDLSEAGRLASEFRAAKSESGTALAERLRRSQDRVRSLTDAFAGRMRGNAAQPAGMGGDLDTAVRETVVSLMGAGQSARGDAAAPSFWQRVISRLLGRV